MLIVHMCVVSCSSFMRNWPFRWSSALESAERTHTNMPGSSSNYWSVFGSFLILEVCDLVDIYVLSGYNQTVFYLIAAHIK